MSLQFTDRGQIMQTVISSPNWKFLSGLLLDFAYYRTDLKPYISRGLLNDLELDLFVDKVTLYSNSITHKELFDWFNNFLAKYEDLKLSEKDKKTLNGIYNRLHLEMRNKWLENLCILQQLLI